MSRPGRRLRGGSMRRGMSPRVFLVGRVRRQPTAGRRVSRPTPAVPTSAVSASRARRAHAKPTARSSSPVTSRPARRTTTRVAGRIPPAATLRQSAPLRPTLPARVPVTTGWVSKRRVAGAGEFAEQERNWYRENRERSLAANWAPAARSPAGSASARRPVERRVPRRRARGTAPAERGRGPGRFSAATGAEHPAHRRARAETPAPGKTCRGSGPRSRGRRHPPAVVSAAFLGSAVLASAAFRRVIAPAPILRIVGIFETPVAARRTQTEGTQEEAPAPGQGDRLDPAHGLRAGHRRGGVGRLADLRGLRAPAGGLGRRHHTAVPADGHHRRRPGADRRNGVRAAVRGRPGACGGRRPGVPGCQCAAVRRPQPGGHRPGHQHRERARAERHAVAGGRRHHPAALHAGPQGRCHRPGADPADRAAAAVGRRFGDRRRPRSSPGSIGPN